MKSWNMEIEMRSFVDCYQIRATRSGDQMERTITEYFRVRNYSHSYQNRTGYQTGEATGSWFIGSTGGSINSTGGSPSHDPKAWLVASQPCSRRLDPGVGVFRGNLTVQSTLCPLMCLRIAADRCVSTELRRSDLAELAMERQPGRGACPNSAKANIYPMHLDQALAQRSRRACYRATTRQQYLP
ncbi:hypothetical protein Acr_00g0077970 [Actinidia rufa]|uniref:Uncharacterized protein n=1 Tax=Actinidia rufa TaxID=165716 RepID=A0A7J0DTK4_9ERIC|nr:hypothetical protein Acr_00g0077970 [Actinidia rufa]